MFIKNYDYYSWLDLIKHLTPNIAMVILLYYPVDVFKLVPLVYVSLTESTLAKLADLPSAIVDDVYQASLLAQQRAALANSSGSK